MTGQFDDELTLPANGGVIEVRGPLRIDDDPDIDGDIESAVIHFVIVQGQGDDTVTADGQGKWARPDGEWTAKLPADAGKHPDGTPGTFSTDVQNGLARGIGLAIAIKPGEVRNGKFVPPAFQELTWCADFKFVPERAA
jgi:hypothetical protein